MWLSLVLTFVGQVYAAGGAPTPAPATTATLSNSKASTSQVPSSKAMPKPIAIWDTSFPIYELSCEKSKPFKIHAQDISSADIFFWSDKDFKGTKSIEGATFPPERPTDAAGKSRKRNLGMVKEKKDLQVNSRNYFAIDFKNQNEDLKDHRFTLQEFELKDRKLVPREKINILGRLVSHKIPSMPAIYYSRIAETVLRAQECCDEGTTKDAIKDCPPIPDKLKISVKQRAVKE